MSDTTQEPEASVSEEASPPEPEFDPRRQQLSDYFLEFLTQPGRWDKAVTCPVCRTFDQWHTGDAVDLPIRFVPGRVYTAIPVVCGNCSYMLLFHGNAADVFDIESNPKRSSRLNMPAQLEFPSEGEGT